MSSLADNLPAVLVIVTAYAICLCFAFGSFSRLRRHFEKKTGFKITKAELSCGYYSIRVRDHLVGKNYFFSYYKEEPTDAKIISKVKERRDMDQTNLSAEANFRAKFEGREFEE